MLKSLDIVLILIIFLTLALMAGVLEAAFLGPLESRNCTHLYILLKEQKEK